MAKQDDDAQAVQVAVRVRNFAPKEMEQDAECIIRMRQEEQGSRTWIKDPETGQEKEFHFDYSFYSVDRDHPDYADQKSVYSVLGKPVLEHALDGRNVCLFAYGQTGSGKSFSMLGGGEGKVPDGIIPQVCQRLFEYKEEVKGKYEVELTMRVFEVYMEKINNVLLPRSQWPAEGWDLHMALGAGAGGYEVRQEAPNTPRLCENVQQIMETISFVDKNRSIGAHALNSSSSRAHTIYTINLNRRERMADGKEKEVRTSVLNLIDLAGSERSSTAETYGTKEFAEGNAINLSLTTLGSVINALASGGQRPIPWRNSKLTLMLKGSLSDGRCIMIAALRPGPQHYEETLSTLNFAKRIKAVRIRARRNVSTNPVEAAKAEMEALRKQLQTEMEQLRGGGGGKGEGAATVEEMSAAKRESQEAERAMEAMYQRRLQQLMEDKQKKEDESQRMLEEWERSLGGLAVLPKGKPTRPSLLNLDPDPRLSGTLVYELKSGANVIGSHARALRTQYPSFMGQMVGAMEDTHGAAGKQACGPGLQVELNLLGILARHCTIDVDDSSGRPVMHLTPHKDDNGEFARVHVNGPAKVQRVRLHHNTRLCLGQGYMFRVVIPGAESESDTVDEEVTYDMATNEVQAAVDDFGGDVPIDDALRRQLSDAIVTVERANLYAQRAKKNVAFDPRLYHNRVDGSEGVFVCATYPDLDTSVVITYEAWELMTDRIETLVRGMDVAEEKNIPWAPPPLEKDPFFIPEGLLVGDAAVCLRPLVFRVRHTVTALILAVNEEVVGHLTVEFRPIDAAGRTGPWRGANADLDPFTSDPKTLIGKTFEAEVCLKSVVFESVPLDKLGDQQAARSAASPVGHAHEAHTHQHDGGTDDLGLVRYTDTYLAMRWPFADDGAGQWTHSSVVAKNTARPEYNLVKRVQIHIDSEETLRRYLDEVFVVQLWGKVDFVAGMLMLKSKDGKADAVRAELDRLQQTVDERRREREELQAELSDLMAQVRTAGLVS
eukprot:TRINITY_DN3634_c0_g1_i1.p1 TRINITY_DN3634_c0_g1~~TRINITY_DN3634_c0_g1_i1.p1  ORF type:complete len:1002 (-),score=226.96 TRINITY_DN3634_c0_g1_i1:1378-4383(-)